MKNKIIYSLFLSMLIWVISTSNAGGKMGAHTTGCGSCHGSAKAATTISLTHNGTVMTSYKPDSTYTVVLNINHTTMTASPNRTGFDLNYSTGTISNAPSGTMLMSTELHHTSPKTMVAGLASWTFKWKAPAAGTGNVTLNVAGNVTNGNNGDDVNDAWNKASYTFTEQTATTGTDTAKISIGITTGSNPSKAGVSIGITATPIKGGTTPSYQWIKNGLNVGGPSTSNTYTSSSFQNNDSVWCVMTSSLSPVFGSPATSNKIRFIITGTTAVNLSESAKFDLEIQQEMLKTKMSINKNAILDIYNLSGTRVYRMATHNDKEHTISFLDKGIYIAQVQLDGQIMTKKFIIQ
jgi:hypothetical protein